MESTCIECGCQLLAYEDACPVCGNRAAGGVDEMRFSEDYGEFNVSDTRVLDDLYLD